LIATGSEVALALTAWGRLTKEGIRAAVVSLPSVDLFEAQDSAYRESVIPAAVLARVVVEAGVSFGWHRYAGLTGELVTLDRFGASAPGEVILEKLGFTVEAVVLAARKSMTRSLGIKPGIL
jgi:transketolase